MAQMSGVPQLRKPLWRLRWPRLTHKDAASTLSQWKIQEKVSRVEQRRKSHGVTGSSSCALHMLQHHSLVLESHLLPGLHDHFHLVVSPCSRRDARCPHTFHAMQPGLKLHHTLGMHWQEGHCWPLPRTTGTQSRWCYSHVPALVSMQMVRMGCCRARLYLDHSKS